ncbi:MAG: hypothetical protein ACK4SU_04820, partial [Dictyoglomus sp.]
EKIKNKYFKEARNNFMNLLPEERLLMITVTYMSLLNRKYFQKERSLKELIKLMDKDFNEFLKIIEKDWYLMDFINKIFTAHPLIEARKNLACNFLKALPKKRRREFIYQYLEFKEKEKRYIEIFIRNYERYNKKWEITLNLKNIPEKFLRKYNLKKMPLILSIYSFDKKSHRKKLINILNQMVI